MHLLFDHFNQLTQTPENLKSLRQWIIDLGVRGQLTQQWREEHPETEPASVLLEKINAEKARLVKEKKIKKPKPSLPITSYEISFKLPSQWVWCRLGEVIKYADNLNIHSELQPNQVVHYVDIDAVDNTSYQIKEPKVQTVSELSSRARRVLKPGYLVYSMVRPYLNNIALVEEEHEYFIGSTGFSVFKGIQVSNLYIFNVLLSSHIRSTFLNYLSGFNSPSINQEQFQQTLIPLPPLAEQQAIVGKVESLLVKVSRLQERAGEVEASKAQVGQSVCGWLADAPLGGETARRFRSVAPQFDEVFSTLPNLKALRQTILQLAIQGKLTEAWRATHPEAEPASALLERIQAEKARLVKEKIKKPNRTTDRPLPPIIGDEVPFDLPEGWVWCRLGEVALYSEAGKSLKCSEVPVVGNQWGIIKVSAVSWGVFKETENKFYSSEPPVEVSSKIEAGDFLLSRANTKELVGRSVIVALCNFNLLLSDKTIRYKFSSLVNLSYINLCNNSTESRIYYSRVATGSSPSMKNITRGQMNELYIPLPPFIEQQAIVEKVESLLAKVRQLEQEVEQNRQYGEQLLQSVLREVMQGSHSSKEATS